MNNLSNSFFSIGYLPTVPMRSPVLCSLLKPNSAAESNCSTRQESRVKALVFFILCIIFSLVAKSCKDVEPSKGEAQSVNSAKNKLEKGIYRGFELAEVLDLEPSPFYDLFCFWDGNKVVDTFSQVTAAQNNPYNSIEYALLNRDGVPNPPAKGLDDFYDFTKASFVQKQNAFVSIKSLRLSEKVIEATKTSIVDGGAWRLNRNSLVCKYSIHLCDGDRHGGSSVLSQSSLINYDKNGNISWRTVLDGNYSFLIMPENGRYALLHEDSYVFGDGTSGPTRGVWVMDTQNGKMEKLPIGKEKYRYDCLPANYSKEMEGKGLFVLLVAYHSEDVNLNNDYEACIVVDPFDKHIYKKTMSNEKKDLQHLTTKELSAFEKIKF